MKVKKIISMLLVSAMAMGMLAGCGSSSGNSRTTETQQETETEVQTEAQTETQQAAQTEEDTTETAEATETASAADTENGETDGTETESGKILVAYYSASGNTEAVANTIAEAAGADLFELEPVEAYSDADLDWTDDSSRVSVEHENEAERDVELVSVSVEDWDSYDTIFIGYPIWWGIAAWPVNNFVKENDFTGKTVIPFATSSSSGLGESGELLAEMAGTGDWQEGMRFRSGVSDADVQAWVEKLGL